MANSGESARQAAQQMVRGIDRLRTCGDIGDAEVVAADRFYRDYVYGVVGARDPEQRSQGGGDAHTTAMARARAVAAYNEVVRRLDPRLLDRLHRFVVDENSISAMAEHYLPNRASTSARLNIGGQLATALMELAYIYTQIDGRRAA
jgi:hypothetical protein